MTPIACTLIRQLAPLLAATVLVTVAGCREDAESPTAPEPGPALEITPADALSFRQVSAGLDHTCGVTLDDRAFCWGNNFFGQLGDGTTTTSSTPVRVVGGLHFRRVSAGDAHTCGVTTENVAYCWGENDGGQLGIGTNTGPETCGIAISAPCSTRPVAVIGGLPFRQVSAGASHTCGAATDDRAYCWGSNFAGQLGTGTTSGRPRPVRVAGGLRFRQVSAGHEHTCGATPSNVAYCWGNNSAGQLGDSTTIQRLVPVRVASGHGFREVNAGGAHTCGVTPRDLALCWGSNRDGQLGDNTRTDRLAPVIVHAHGLRFLQIRAGGSHTCGVTTENVAYCWGQNLAGQLGNGTTFRRLLPTAVAGGLAFRQLDASSIHTCGVTTSDVAYCWGNNVVGQLGDSTTIQRLVPVRVGGP